MELTTNLMLLLTGITILVWGANKFVDHASREEMIVECGLDSKSLEKSIKKYC